MGKTESALTRKPRLVDSTAPLTAVVSLDDAARKAVAILAAGVFAASAATMVCLAIGIHNGLDPADVPAIRNLFPSLRVGDFVPEPLERAQAVAFIAGAYIMSIALVLFPRLDSMIPPMAARLFWALFASAVVGYFVFGQEAFQIPSRFFGTWESVWLPEDLVLWLVTFGVTASPLLVHSAGLRRHITHFLAAISILALVLLCARYTFVAPADGLASDLRNHHDSAVLHSIVQSAFGQIPYLDFIPQYGGYGLFAIPLFRLGLDPWTALCLFLFFCTLVSFFSMGIAVALASRSWQCGSLAGIVMFWLSGLAHSGLSFFQGTPVRTFFPSIFLLLFSLYTKSPRLVSAISGFMIPLAIYWNPETGIVCLAASASFLLFDVVVHLKRNDSAMGPRLSPLLMFFAACFCASAILEAAAFVFLDRLVPIADLFFHAALFSKLGYLNLPMPLLDVWVPAAFTLCLLLSFPTSVSPDADPFRTRAFFGYFCAMLFAGLFFYYQGRSYTGNLVGFAFPIACGGFSWLWSDSKSLGSRCKSTLQRPGLREYAGMRPLILQRDLRTGRISRFPVAGRDVAILAFAVASAAIAGSSFMSAPILNPLSMTMGADNRSLRAFIRNESRGYQAAFIVSPQAWRLHLLSGVAPPKNLPPQSGLLSRLQEEETIRAVDPGSGYVVFVDSQYFSPKARLGSPFPTILLARINSYRQRGDSLKLHSGEFTVFKPKVPLERRMPGPDHAQFEIPR